MKLLHFSSDLVLVPLAGLALGGLLRFGIAPLVERLPTDYTSETHYVSEDQFRESATAPWVTSSYRGRRTDRVLVTSAGFAIVEGDLHWSTAAGEVLFDVSGLYGIDPVTRSNVPNTGDAARTGQFLFPPHTSRSVALLWDSLFIGPRHLTFDHADRLQGLPVDVYHFQATGLDESAGYQALPDVPERYRAGTDVQGTLWLDPVSGLILDYEDQAVSYFVDPTTGARVTDFHHWSEHYAPETRTTQAQLAATARLRIGAVEFWLPLAALLAGLGWIAARAGFGGRARTRHVGPWARPALGGRR